MITFCLALIFAGIIFLMVGVGGTIGLKIPQIGYIGVPMGIVLIVLGLVLQMVGVC